MPNFTTTGTPSPALGNGCRVMNRPDWRLLAAWLALAGAGLGPDPALASGGSVVRLPERSAITAFLAQPAPGFRFASWDGGCSTTIGPLCTVAAPAGQDVAARFEPAPVGLEPSAAILLLHGAGQDRRIWDSTVNREFAGECPAIYGGVVLGREAVQRQTALRCYRIEFGYYEAFSGGRKEFGDRSSAGQLNAEVRAAVVGIRQEHPGLRLVLAGCGRGYEVARRFLLHGGPQRQAVAGTLEMGMEPARPCRSEEIVQRAKELL